jgi:PEP-CTERM/exosortase A-associated glycosyltransferase
MRVLHVLDHSLPYFSGYAFRSDYIIRTQRRLGFEPIVLTSPKHEDFAGKTETMGDVEFHRLPWPPLARRLPVIRQAACVVSLERAIARLATQRQVDVIHAHSPSLNGLAAARAAGRLRKPWVYEVRYFEEDAAVDRGKLAAGSPRYRFLQHLELAAARRATRVTAIGRALRDDLIARGIEGGKIDEIPNGVDTGFFTPREPDAELIARHNLAGKMVVGFIGSFYFYEGLRHLVEAMRLLLERRRDVLLLLAGEGEAEPDLRARIPAPLREHFLFAGKVPHRDVRRYYSVMDVLVYPRIASRLTEMTTPLKPLEAMAMERAVVGSRVGGIRELLGDGEAGYLTEADNPREIADCLWHLAEHPAERAGMGRRARRFVTSRRDWEFIVARYSTVYREALRLLE